MEVKDIHFIFGLIAFFVIILILMYSHHSCGSVVKEGFGFQYDGTTCITNDQCWGANSKCVRKNGSTSQTSGEIGRCNINWDIATTTSLECSGPSYSLAECAQNQTCQLVPGSENSVTNLKKYYCQAAPTVPALGRWCSSNADCGTFGSCVPVKQSTLLNFGYTNVCALATDP